MSGQAALRAMRMRSDSAEVVPNAQHAPQSISSTLVECALASPRHRGEGLFEGGRTLGDVLVAGHGHVVGAVHVAPVPAVRQRGSRQILLDPSIRTLPLRKTHPGRMYLAGEGRGHVARARAGVAAAAGGHMRRGQHLRDHCEAQDSNQELRHGGGGERERETEEARGDNTTEPLPTE